MNPHTYAEAVQAAVKKKFRGHTTLKSKAIPAYPQNAERAYKTLTSEYMGLYEDVLKKHMPALKRALEFYGGKRFDDDETPMQPDEIFTLIEEELKRKLTGFNVLAKIRRVAEMSTKLSIEDWRRMCQTTLGINILEDYYKGDFFKQAIGDWVQSNVDLITTQPKDSLEKMRGIVREGFFDGRRPEVIAKDINASYTTSKQHAKMIARDQTAKLNGQITQAQQKDAGVKEYIWDTSRDRRVRPSHRKLHGKKFRWDEPPIVDEKTGRRCHPGEDYQCRCVAIPVFSIEGVAEIPVAPVDWKAVDDRFKPVLAQEAEERARAREKAKDKAKKDKAKAESK